jgi:hypothetical protein
MIVFGGYPYNDETWALNLSGPPEWTALGLSPERPSARAHASAIYDPVRDRVVLFGGENGTFAGYFNDLWSLDLSGTPTWSLLSASGTLPTAREGHSAIYDPVGDRMVIFGGYSYYVVRNDLWTLSLSGTPTWTVWNAGSIPSRFEHAAIYDAGRDRLVIHSGMGTRETRLDDAWGLILRNGHSWTKLDPDGFPPVRSAHAAVYDPVRGRAVIFGGAVFKFYGAPYAYTTNDAFSLTWGDPLADAPAIVPTALALFLPRPNPSARVVSFEFDLPRAASISIDILDIQGRRVRGLERGFVTPGRHIREWDGFDDYGGRAPAGVYFLRLQDPEGTAYRRILRVP